MKTIPDNLTAKIRFEKRDLSLSFCIPPLHAPGERRDGEERLCMSRGDLCG